MNWEIIVALAVVAIPGILSLIGQMAGLASSRNAPAEWQKLYDERGEQISELEEKVEQLEKRIRIMKADEQSLFDRIEGLEKSLSETKEKLTTAELNIDFLLDYIKSNNVDVPELKFRG